MLGLLPVFLAVSLTVFFAAQWLAPMRSGRVDERLRQLNAPVPAGPSRLDGLGNRSMLQGLGALIEPVLERLHGVQRLQRLLRDAGLAWRASEYVALMGLAAIAGAVLGCRVAGLLGGLLGALAASAAPLWQLRQKAVQRKRTLNDQLPDGLMLMVNALRAGNSLTQSMNVVGQQMPAPIGGVFRESLLEINYGLPVDVALGHLQDRFGGIDMALATSAILIQRETGGNLAEVLDNIHHTIRDRLTVQGEMRALTAQGRLSGLILSLLPAALGALFFVLNRPYIMTLFIDPRGQMLVAAGTLLTAVGMLAIRKIVSVDY